MRRDDFTLAPPDVREIRHFGLFCGLGGGSKGLNEANPRVGSMVGRFRCLGGVDVDPAALRDFERLTGAPGTCLDLFDEHQYEQFHGHRPPAGWKEATPDDIRRAAGYEHPHIVFLSAPCQGLSGLLSESMSKTRKYTALNRLTVRGIWLMLEAFKDDLPELIVFENVPRVATRGRDLLDQINGLLRAYGYAVAETVHDCGELGGMAQSRRRFLMVARHLQKVPPFLYQPDQKPLASVGSILGRMRLPGDPAAGPMHRIPELQWATWVRLALVEAGADWRSLERLQVAGGHLADLAVVPEWRNGTLGVCDWAKPCGTVTGNGRPGAGKFSVADPRFRQSAQWNDGQQYGVLRWTDSMGTITGQQSPGQGTFSVADPREQSADALRFLLTSEQGAPVDAEHAPAANQHLVAMIRSLDGTWHRPFTVLELAALQSLVDPEEHLVLDGASTEAWRKRIGNAVPPAAARAIGEVMGTTLLLAWAGETFSLSSAPIWVRPIEVALSVDLPSWRPAMNPC